MARKLRLEFPGALYWISNEGNRGQATFQEDADRDNFLDCLAQTCRKTSWKVWAFSLVPHQFYLLLETPQPNLVIGMKRLLGSYTNSFNRRHQLSGHLFSGRYRAGLVEVATHYILRAAHWVHLAPVRERVLTQVRDLTAYPWCSLRDYGDPGLSRQDWLNVHPVMRACGLRGSGPRNAEAYLRLLEIEHGAPEIEEPFQATWMYGSESFRQEVRRHLLSAPGAAPNRYGERHWDGAVAGAEALVMAELTKLGWVDEDLKSRAKGDTRKLQIALRLRSETTAKLDWITKRLRMGTRTYLAHLIYWERRRLREETQPKSRETKRRTRRRAGSLKQKRSPAGETNWAASLHTFDPTFD